MVSLELQLDEQTLARARIAAQERHQTLEQIVAKVIEDLGKPVEPPPAAASSGDGIIGLFADEPQLMDEIVEEAMKLREARWACYRDGQGGH